MSTLAPELNQSTALTPVPLTTAELEANKLRQHKAEDVIYTLNHAVTCLGVTDTLVGPWVGALSEKWFGDNWFDHGHEHGHAGHTHADGTYHEHDHGHGKSFWGKLGHWVTGELVGDLGAVPVTIAIQLLMPNFMHGLRRLMEPAVGGLFRSRTQKAAENWADKNGVDRQAQEVVDRAQHLYEYEMSHLPQMVMWTAISPVLNFATMKLMDEDMNMAKFVRGKSVGAVLTAGMIFGMRAFSPATAHQWDSTVGKHVVLPITKRIGGVFGINAKDVDDYHAKHGEHDDAPAPAPTSSISGAKQHAGAVVDVTQKAVI